MRPVGTVEFTAIQARSELSVEQRCSRRKNYQNSARRDTLPSSGGRILCRQSHIGIVSQHEANTGGGRCEYFIQATPLRSTFAETCLDVAVHSQAATSSGHPQAVKINSECLQNVRERSRPIEILSWKAAIVFPQAAVATFPAPRDAGRAGGRRSNRRRCMRDRA